MTSWLVLALLSLAALGALLLLARYRHADTLQSWVLTPDAERLLSIAEDNAALDQAMMTDAWAESILAQEREEWQEAVRLLELAFWVVEDATPSRLQRLRAMAVLIRQAAAVLPLPAVRPSGYRLARMRGLAGAGALLHAFLVSPAERLASRARMLAAAFLLLVWTMRRAKDRVRPEPGKAWRTFAAAIPDWITTDRAHVETYRAALQSLGEFLRRAA